MTLGALYDPAAPKPIWRWRCRTSGWPPRNGPGGGACARSAGKNCCWCSQRTVTRQKEPYISLEWTPAVECTDSDNPSNPFVSTSAHLAYRLAPYFGSPSLYFALPCATCTARDPDRYVGPWNRRTANPVLLIGNSEGDPATPYEDAVSTERELTRGGLLTLEWFGHTAFFQRRVRRHRGRALSDRQGTPVPRHRLAAGPRAGGGSRPRRRKRWTTGSPPSADHKAQKPGAAQRRGRAGDARSSAGPPAPRS